MKRRELGEKEACGARLRPWRRSPRVWGGGGSDTFDQQHRTKIPEQDLQRGQRIPHQGPIASPWRHLFHTGLEWTDVRRPNTSRDPNLAHPTKSTPHGPRTDMYNRNYQTLTTNRPGQRPTGPRTPAGSHEERSVPTEPSARPLQTPTRLRLPWRGGHDRRFSGHTKTTAEAEPPVLVTAPPARVGALRLRWKRSRP